MITLTKKQVLWLDQQGERTKKDVKEDERGMYVAMSDGEGGKSKKYLPDDRELMIYCTVPKRKAKARTWVEVRRFALR